MMTQEIRTPRIASNRIISLLEVDSVMRPGALNDPQKQNFIFAGWGSCNACGCTGYVSKKPDICRCGHHFSQHD